MSSPRQLKVHALSIADELGYMGQQAVSEAVADGCDYLIVGGHMVRLMLSLYPTPRATLRSTLDADAAIDDVEVAGSIAENLIGLDFTKQRGNVFVRQHDAGQWIEINLLLPRSGHGSGLRPLTVGGVGRVDSLPELRFALGCDALELEIEAVLMDGRTIEYQTRIPDLEAAIVLKAHAWKDRCSEKDLADLHSLFEIRDEHPHTPWLLDDTAWMAGFRKDTARILLGLRDRLAKKNPGVPVPGHLDKLRMAGLINKHVCR
ncbi:hypothetical protein [Rhodococcus sp. IEGM 1408]|uniref:hypothetical protein n=1 Tax=Rhodococcus sp. IEGM 1408 TaxID=3082220 RepID=UPI002954E6AA|nr:hypothetical protein [Rhodococcus sp. IEGM 1408]MDV8002794.1 hypothetical protein [Rhodococcus sp. IEGM 1408]